MTDLAWRQEEQDDDWYDSDAEDQAFFDDDPNPLSGTGSWILDAALEAEYDRWHERAEVEEAYWCLVQKVVQVESVTYTYEIVNGRRVLFGEIPF